MPRDCANWVSTEVLKPLCKADGIAIIDSDPGGYPGSTSEEFVELLVAHLAMVISPLQLS